MKIKEVLEIKPTNGAITHVVCKNGLEFDVQPLTTGHVVIFNESRQGKTISEYKTKMQPLDADKFIIREGGGVDDAATLKANAAPGKKQMTEEEELALLEKQAAKQAAAKQAAAKTPPKQAAKPQQTTTQINTDNDVKSEKNETSDKPKAVMAVENIVPVTPVTPNDEQQPITENEEPLKTDDNIDFTNNSSEPKETNGSEADNPEGDDLLPEDDLIPLDEENEDVMPFPKLDEGESDEGDQEENNNEPSEEISIEDVPEPESSTDDHPNDEPEEEPGQNSEENATEDIANEPDQEEPPNPLEEPLNMPETVDIPKTYSQDQIRKEEETMTKQYDLAKLIGHLTILSKGGVFKCSKCNNELEIHPDGKLQCKFCASGYPSTEGLQKYTIADYLKKEIDDKKYSIDSKFKFESGKAYFLHANGTDLYINTENQTITLSAPGVIYEQPIAAKVSSDVNNWLAQEFARATKS